MSQARAEHASRTAATQQAYEVRGLTLKLPHLAGRALCDGVSHTLPCTILQRQLAEVEDDFQKRLLAEGERCTALEQERDALDARWQAQAAALVAQHGRVVEEVAASTAAELAAARQAVATLQQVGLLWRGLSGRQPAFAYETPGVQGFFFLVQF